MAIKPIRYQHVPVFVEAVQVTAENMAEVAAWAGGKVAQVGDNKFIKVEIPGAKSWRHTQAHIGDRVLKTDHGIKIYTPKAFEMSFVIVEEAGFEVV